MNAFIKHYFLIFLHFLLRLYFHPMDMDGFIFFDIFGRLPPQDTKKKRWSPLHPTHRYTCVSISTTQAPHRIPWVLKNKNKNLMLGDIATVTTQIHLDILTFQIRYVLAFLFNLPTFQRTYTRLDCRLGKEREREKTYI